MPRKSIELPTAVVRAFVQDMCAFFAETNTIKADEIAARQAWALDARGATMTPRFPQEFPARLIDRCPFVVMGDMTPPRDPDENGDDEDEGEEEYDEDESADEPPVVREPDEG